MKMMKVLQNIQAGSGVRAHQSKHFFLQMKNKGSERFHDLSCSTLSSY
jgi:hypothetical protein